MINFKTFLLQEKAMNSTVFTKTLERLSDKAVMGFEIEAWVNEQSPVFSSGGKRGGSIPLDDIDSFDAWKELFILQRDVRDDIMSEFDDWRADNGAGLSVRAAWTDYFDAEFDGSPVDFIRTYDIEPRFGWYEKNKAVFVEEPTEFNADWSAIAVDAAQELSNVVGEKVHVGYTGNVKDWVVVRDDSIESDNEDEIGIGIEIVSPPQPVDEAMDNLAECFDFITRFKLTTNRSTGLHINLSIPNLKESLDPLKLIVFLGEDYMLKQFKREGNKYAATHKQSIISSIENFGGPPPGSDIVSFARKILSTEKYKTINLSKLKSGYLEFRVAGNSGYETNWRKIQDTIGRFLTALEIACDPAAERKVYLRKVAKLLDIGAATNDPEVDSLPGLIRKAAGQVVYKQLDDLLKEPNISKTLAATYLRRAMVDIGKEIQRRDYQPSPHMIAAWKFFYNKFSKKVPNLRQALDAEELYPGEQEKLDLFRKTFRVK